METSLPTAAYMLALECNKPEPGRCVYCGERCNADTTWHHYCRLDYEYEARHSLGKVRIKSQLRPRETE